MALVLLEVELEVDGVPAEGFPYVRRLSIPALHPFLCVTKAGEPLSTYKTVGNNEVEVVELAVLHGDGPAFYRLDGDTSPGIEFGEGEHALILCDTNIDAGAVANIGAPGDGKTVKINGFIGGQPPVDGDCLGYGEGGYGEGGYGCGI